MKLPANVLAICLLGAAASAGCETAVDFERRSAPPATSAATGRGEVQTVEVDLGRVGPSYAKPPPAAAPKPAPTPRPTITIKPAPQPQPKAKAIECGPCGMG